MGMEVIATWSAADRRSLFTSVASDPRGVLPRPVAVEVVVARLKLFASRSAPLSTSNNPSQPSFALLPISMVLVMLPWAPF